MIQQLLRAVRDLSGSNRPGGMEDGKRWWVMSTMAQSITTRSKDRYATSEVKPYDHD